MDRLNRRMTVAFVSSPNFVFSGASSVRQCPRRRPQSPRAQTGTGGDQPPSWGSSSWGQRAPEKLRQGKRTTIEFTIRQDGTVIEKVIGAKGLECTKLTKKIEESLGRVTHTEHTDEYFEKNYEEITDQMSQEQKWDGGEDYPAW